MRNINMKKKVIFKPYNQNQDYLLPPRISDLIDIGHVCRLISTIIDQMDLTFIQSQYKGGGTSAYNPSMLLKVWILGFVNRIYSCRLAAKALRENLTFMWISGKQTPDFHTLNNFRLRLKYEIKDIFKQIVRYGIEKGIIEGKDIFIDHTKKVANSNKHKVLWRKQVMRQSDKIDKELDDLFDYIDQVNEEEDNIFGDKDLPEKERKGFDPEKVKEIAKKINEKIKKGDLSSESGKEIKKNIRRTNVLIERKESYNKKKALLNGRNSCSRTDTDAVAMMMKDKLTIRPGYNEGIAVENGFVLNYVISDNASDGFSFIPLMNGTIDNLGKTPENANTDGAYGNEENHSFLEEKKIGNFAKFSLFHKERSKAWREKRIRFQDFTYNKDKNEFQCKNGAILAYEIDDIEETGTGYKRVISKYKVKGNKCSGCIYKNKCTNSKVRTLQVSWKAEGLKDKARKNLDSEKGLELRKRRGNEVESVFGDDKMNGKKRRYNLRGINKVNIEAGLLYIAHNIKKIRDIIKNKKKKSSRNIKTLKFFNEYFIKSRLTY